MLKKSLCMLMAAVLLCGGMLAFMQVSSQAIAEVIAFDLLQGLLISMGISIASEQAAIALKNKIIDSPSLGEQWLTDLMLKATVIASVGTLAYHKLAYDDYANAVSDLNSGLGIDPTISSISGNIDTSGLYHLANYNSWDMASQSIGGFNIPFISDKSIKYYIGNNIIDISIMSKDYILVTAELMNGNKHRCKIAFDSSSFYLYRKQNYYFDITNKAIVPLIFGISQPIMDDGDSSPNYGMYVSGKSGAPLSVDYRNRDILKISGEYFYYINSTDSWIQGGNSSGYSIISYASSNSIDIPIDNSQNALLDPSALANSYSGLGSIPIAILDSYIGATPSQILTSNPAISNPDNPAIDLPDTFPITGEVSVVGPVEITGDISIPAAGSAADGLNKLKLPSIIASKFPFCIPFDLYNCITQLAATPKAPYFEIPIKFANLYDGSMKIDLSFLDKPMIPIRWILSILFTFLLIVGTRKLVRG